MTASTLGTKRKCPDCSARFYDLGASKVVCPKCSFSLADNPVRVVSEQGDAVAIMTASAGAANRANATQNKDSNTTQESITDSPNTTTQTSEESMKNSTSDDSEMTDPYKLAGEVSTLEDIDDYDDIDHLEEVEEHHEAPEIDMNSDDADDEMFVNGYNNDDEDMPEEVRM